MNKRKAGAALLTGVLAVSMAACGGTKALDGTQTAVTVNGEAVSAGTVSFEAHYQEAWFNSYYGAYFGDTEYFDTPADEEDGTSTLTVGDTTVNEVADSIIEDMVVYQHASEYGGELTEEQKTAIDTAAQAFIDANDAETIKKMGVSKDDVVLSMTLDTVKANMMEGMAADVDTEVSDEEAQQTSYSYVSMFIATDEDEDGTSAEDQNAAIEEQLNEVLDKIKASDDIAEADMTAIAQEVNEEFYGGQLYYSTNSVEEDRTDTAVVEAIAGLEDGELYDGIVTSEDGERYLLIRLDKTFDEDRTSARKDTIVVDRKQAQYDEIAEGWKEEAEIEIKDDVLRQIKITDSDKYTFKTTDSEG